MNPQVRGCCGILKRYTLAEVYADRLAWHQVARLVQHGCPPRLALRIAR
jgi:hypothetical protein